MVENLHLKPKDREQSVEEIQRRLGLLAKDDPDFALGLLKALMYGTAIIYRGHVISSRTNPDLAHEFAIVPPDSDKRVSLSTDREGNHTLSVGLPHPDDLRRFGIAASDDLFTKKCWSSVLDRLGAPSNNV